MSREKAVQLFNIRTSIVPCNLFNGSMSQLERYRNFHTNWTLIDMILKVYLIGLIKFRLIDRVSRTTERRWNKPNASYNSNNL